MSGSAERAATRATEFGHTPSHRPAVFPSQVLQDGVKVLKLIKVLKVMKVMNVAKMAKVTNIAGAGRNNTITIDLTDQGATDTGAESFSRTAPCLHFPARP